eukprot:TRINITY_DN22637_c0_g1_i1.p1 TRINITY_DN22637_c0_g1~~TRINITY_DN22637_c0_g1_i1.p1  ORF type:complete len:102 (-),score=4.63 TRINITY_DN22637_c0_g1_i1:33-338(-)
MFEIATERHRKKPKRLEETTPTDYCFTSQPVSYVRPVTKIMSGRHSLIIYMKEKEMLLLFVFLGTAFFFLLPFISAITFALSDCWEIAIHYHILPIYCKTW